MHNLLTQQELVILNQLEKLLRVRNELQVSLTNSGDYLERKELYRSLRNWIDDQCKAIIEGEIK